MVPTTSLPQQTWPHGVHFLLLTASMAYAAAGFSLSVLSLLLRTVINETIIQQYTETPNDKHPNRRISAPQLGRRSKRASMVSLTSRRTTWSGNVSLPHVSPEGVSIFVSPAAPAPKQEDLGYFPYVPPSDDMSDGLRPTDVKAMMAKAKTSGSPSGSPLKQASVPERKRKIRPFTIRAFSSPDSANIPEVHCLAEAKACPTNLLKSPKNARPKSPSDIIEQDPQVHTQTTKCVPGQQPRDRPPSSRTRTQPYAAPYFLPPPDTSVRIRSIHPSRSTTLQSPATKGLRKLKSSPEVATSA